MFTVSSSDDSSAKGSQCSSVSSTVSSRSFNDNVCLVGEFEGVFGFLTVLLLALALPLPFIFCDRVLVIIVCTAMGRVRNGNVESKKKDLLWKVEKL